MGGGALPLGREVKIMETLIHKTYIIHAPEIAAIKLAEEQHAPGVTVRMNENYKVEYVRTDGSIVPNYEYYLKLALAGEI